MALRIYTWRNARPLAERRPALPFTWTSGGVSVEKFVPAGRAYFLPLTVMIFVSV
jgi:hypothetical protein